MTYQCSKCGRGSSLPTCPTCLKKTLEETLGLDDQKENHMQPDNALDQSLDYAREKHGTLLGRYNPLMKSLTNYKLNQGIASKIGPFNKSYENALKTNYNLFNKSYNPLTKNSYNPRTNYGGSGKSYDSSNVSRGASYSKSGYSSKACYGSNCGSGKK
jgi:hypothetical protein